MKKTMLIMSCLVCTTHASPSLKEVLFSPCKKEIDLTKPIPFIPANESRLMTMARFAFVAWILYSQCSSIWYSRKTYKVFCEIAVEPGPFSFDLHKMMPKLNFSDSKKTHILLIAAKHGYPEKLLPLIQELPEIYKEKASLLLPLALDNQNINNAEVLLCHGVPVYGSLRNGNRALHIAAEYNNSGIIEALLLQMPARYLNVRDAEYKTPLHLACMNGHEVAVKLLIEADAEVNLYDMHSNTPVDYVIQGGYSEIFKMLLHAGALCHLTNAQEGPVLHTSCFSYSKGIEQLVPIMLNFQKYQRQQQFGSDITNILDETMRTDVKAQRI